MALAGVPPLVFAIVGLIDLLYQFWVHTEQVRRLGWFDRWFCAPSNHRVHHAVNDCYLDRNYGGILRSEEHTSELQSPCNLVCRLLLEKKNDLLGAVLRNHDRLFRRPPLRPGVEAWPFRELVAVSPADARCEVTTPSPAGPHAVGIFAH